MLAKIIKEGKWEYRFGVATGTKTCNDDVQVPGLLVAQCKRNQSLNSQKVAELNKSNSRISEGSTSLGEWEIKNLPT